MTLEFDEQTGSETKNSRLLYAKFQKSSQTPPIILFLIRKRIVRNEDSARRLLLIITLVVFALSIYMIVNSFSGPVFIDKIK